MKNTRIEEKEAENRTLYLEVEPHYTEPAVGRGEDDAVMFEMGQVTDGKRGIDSVVTCSTEKARSFAKSILKVCNEIEKEFSDEALIEEFKNACLNLPGSGGRGRSRYFEVEEMLLKRMGGGGE